MRDGLSRTRSPLTGALPFCVRRGPRSRDTLTMIRLHQRRLFVRIEPGKNIEDFTGIHASEVPECVRDTFMRPQRARIGRGLEKNAKLLTGYGLKLRDVIVSTLGNQSNGRLSQR